MSDIDNNSGNSSDTNSHHCCYHHQFQLQRPIIHLNPANCNKNTETDNTSLSTTTPFVHNKRRIYDHNHNHNNQRELQEPLLQKDTAAATATATATATTSTEKEEHDPVLLVQVRDSILLQNPFVMVHQTFQGGPTAAAAAAATATTRADYDQDELEDRFHDELDQDSLNRRSSQPQQQQQQHAHAHSPWYKNPYQVMAMMSNFGTSFNVVNVSLVLPILAELDQTKHANTQETSAVASSLLAGMIFGQVVGGALGDSFLGLAGALRVVMLLQIAASLGSASVRIGNGDTSHNPAAVDQFYWDLALWRFVLGLGAGAVYPLAACLSVEHAGMTTSQQTHIKSALKRVVLTFAVQGLGFWMVPALTLPLLRLHAIPLEYTWRILLASGCLPGFVLLYLQWRLYRGKKQIHLTTNASISTLQQQEQEHQQQEEEMTSDQDHPLHQHHHHHRHSLDHSHNDGEHASLASQRRQRQQLLLLQQTHSVPPVDLLATSSRHGRGDGRNQPNQQQLQQGEEKETGSVQDRELMCEDSDGEVGTFLDSSPDLSSGGEGCFGPSEPPAIRQGWWASIITEPQLCQKLLGTAATWFLFDVLFYGNTLFQPLVVEAAFGTKRDDDYNDNDDYNNNRGVDLLRRHLLQRTARNSLLLTSIALPGYAVAGLLIGQKISLRGPFFCYGCTGITITQSARYVMLQGFALMSLLYFAIGGLWHTLKAFPTALVLLYGLTFFFANYGPNTTTFVLPSLVYSAECRSTFNGLSAAAGKLGALTGATLFAPAANSMGDANVMLLCGTIGCVAFLITALFVKVSPDNDDNNNNNHYNNHGSHDNSNETGTFDNTPHPHSAMTISHVSITTASPQDHNDSLLLLLQQQQQQDNHDGEDDDEEQAALVAAAGTATADSGAAIEIPQRLQHRYHHHRQGQQS